MNPFTLPFSCGRQVKKVKARFRKDGGWDDQAEKKEKIWEGENPDQLSKLWGRWKS